MARDERLQGWMAFASDSVDGRVEPWLSKSVVGPFDDEQVAPAHRGKAPSETGGLALGLAAGAAADSMVSGLFVGGLVGTRSNRYRHVVLPSVLTHGSPVPTGFTTQAFCCCTIRLFCRIRGHP